MSVWDALGEGQLDAPHLGGGLPLPEKVGQQRRQPPKLGVAEAVVGGGGNSFGDEGAVRPVDSLRDRDQALVLRLIDLVDIRQKAFHVKIHLGKVDEIRAVAHPGSQSSRAGQPAGVASHDLQNGNGSVVVHNGTPMQVVAMYRAAEPKPGQWSVPLRSLSMVLGTPMTRHA